MRKSVVLGLIMTLFLLTVFGGSAQAAPGEVLILARTVTNGLNSFEAKAVVAAGKTPVVVTDAQWAAMSGGDFAQYDGIVLGDPTCSTSGELISAAVNNRFIWAPAVDGNVIIIGSDPVYHASSQSGALKLINQGISFSVSKANTTGAYIDLSCYYHFFGAGTPVPVLDGLNGGGFQVIGANNLPGLNNVHITAVHPALNQLTDADLSNWGNSVHEGFNVWPIDFEALAVARDINGSYTAPDGTRGYPYILARGVTVVSDIKLSPETAVNQVGSTHALSAAVKQDGIPLSGVNVTFSVIAGPHLGTTGTDATDIDGNAAFSYMGTTAGEDTIEATFVNSKGITQRSNRVKKTWTKVCAPCDLNGDCIVNLVDYSLFRGSYGKTPGQSGYLPAADMNKSGGVINLTDYGIWNSCYQANK